MKLFLFSIHDSKAEAFIQPYYAVNSAVGRRIFETACNDDSVEFSKHPGDYGLFELGTFDQDTGRFELLEHPINHGLAIIYKHAPTHQQPVLFGSEEDVDQNITPIGAKTA